MYIPICYQKGNGNKFKIDLSNSLQFDLQNDSVSNIRRQSYSETKQLNYNKCTECLFKIPLNAKICNICNTNIQRIPLKEDNDNKMDENSNNKVDKNNNKPPKVENIDIDDIKMEPKDNNNNIEPLNNKPPEQLSPPKIDPVPVINDNEFLLCPFCKTKNKKDFNFCVGCRFDLSQLKKNENNNNAIKVDDDNDININKENENEVGNDMNVDPGVCNNDNLNAKDDVNIFNIEQPGSGKMAQDMLDDDDVEINEP